MVLLLVVVLVLLYVVVDVDEAAVVVVVVVDVFDYVVFNVCLFYAKKNIICLNNNGKRREAIRDNLTDQFLCKIQR